MKFWKTQGIVIMVSLIMLVLAFLFIELSDPAFRVQNHLTIHLIIEIVIIIISFTIALQAWMIFPHILSNHRLWLGSLFLSIGILEIFQVITYKGMPFFLVDSSPYRATWFYIVNRVTQALCLLLIVVTKEKQVQPQYRWGAYGLAFFYSLLWIAIILHPNQVLPQLVVEGIGTTALKNGLQYTAIILQFLIIVVLVKNIKSKETFNRVLILASIYLMIGDSMFTTYKSVYDVMNFVGHIFQVFGFYFLLRALYYSSVEEPFQKLKEAREHLAFVAHHDETSKLPNSRYIDEKLDQMIEQHADGKVVVLLLEMARFKTINQSLGYTFGDLVLQSVAARLRESLSDDLFLGKLRGDKFCILAPSAIAGESPVGICRHIHEALHDPFVIQGLLLNVTVNIGIAVYPEHGEAKSELLRHAQIAMNEAEQDVDRFAIFHPTMEQQSLARLVLEQDLHKALEKNELHVVYQPQVDLCNGQILALEALLRWKHPKQGWISPGQFIPIAEETGLIIPIGEWVLRTACRQVKAWHEQGFPPFGISVNLSTRQFFQHNLAEKVEEILEETDLPSHYLELEITESMTMNVSHAIGVLQKLKKLGVKVSVDDFGTGYSSLNYLKELPIDRLKIDQSFIRNILEDKQNAALTSMIISMAKFLEIKVIAEGVETLEQFRYLERHQCHQGQGYLFSPPISAEDFTAQFFEKQNQFQSYVLH